MLYKKYTKTNLFKELEKSKAYVESKYSVRKLVVVLVFDKETKEFKKSCISIDQFAEAVNYIDKNYNEHLENDKEKIVIIRPYCQSKITIDKYLDEVIKHIYHRAEILQKFNGDDPKGFNWLIPNKEISEYQYQILLLEKRKNLPPIYRDKFKKFDEIMRIDEAQTREEARIKRKDRYNNEKKEKYEKMINEEKYNELLNLIKNLEKRIDELNTKIEDASNNNVQQCSVSKISGLFKPLILLNDMKVYNTYEEIKNDIKNKKFEIFNTQAFVDIYNGTRNTVGKIDENKCYWIRKDIYNKLNETEKKAINYITKEQIISCVYSPELDMFFNNSSSAAKYCSDNNFFFVKACHIEDCINGSKNFAGVSPDEKILHWQKFIFSDLNKEKEDN